MRITQQILYGNFMRDVNKNRMEMGDLQSKLANGKNVSVASDDPVSFQRARILEENVRKEEQYQSNIDSGLRQSRLAQETLDEVINRLIDIKSLSVQGATDSAGGSVRKNIADELRGIKESMVNTLNVSYGERFLFSGTNSAVQPFEMDDTAPGGVTNNSNSTPPRVMVGDGLTIDMSVTGVDLRDTPAGDMFQVLTDLENALRANDTQAINDMLAPIDDVIEHATDITSRLGNNINRMEFMFERYESFRITQKADISSLVDADYAETFSALQRTQTLFEAAMAVHTTMFNGSLLDYL
jgi:flagellar hook-associated protein 3 FlgL